MREFFDKAREALAFLEHHQLDPSPANYDFAFRYVTDPGSDLASDVDGQTYGGLRLTSDAMLGLVQRHLLDGARSELDQRERTVVRQAQELGTLTSGAQDLTEALGREVGAIVKRSDQWPAGTTDLVDRLSDAEREISDLRREFKKLRDAIGEPGQQPPSEWRPDSSPELDQNAARQALELLVKRSNAYVLMVFSIDDLAGIRNRFGSAVGDNVLNAFAATLHQVFPDVNLVRWTVNEFIIVANDLATLGARLLIEDALTAMRARRLKLRGTGEWIGTVTASAGMVVNQSEALEVVLERARAKALLAADQGGDRFEG